MSTNRNYPPIYSIDSLASWEEDWFRTRQIVPEPVYLLEERIDIGPEGRSVSIRTFSDGTMEREAVPDRLFEPQPRDYSVVSATAIQRDRVIGRGTMSRYWGESRYWGDTRSVEEIEEVARRERDRVRQADRLNEGTFDRFFNNLQRPAPELVTRPPAPPTPEEFVQPPPIQPPPPPPPPSSAATFSRLSRSAEDIRRRMNDSYSVRGMDRVVNETLNSTLQTMAQMCSALEAEMRKLSDEKAAQATRIEELEAMIDLLNNVP